MRYASAEGQPNVNLTVLVLLYSLQNGTKDRYDVSEADLHSLYILRMLCIALLIFSMIRVILSLMFLVRNAITDDGYRGIAGLLIH